MTWHRHRTRNPRRCDRCRQPAAWNLVRKGHLVEYLCSLHAPLAADAYRVERPPQ